VTRTRARAMRVVWSRLILERHLHTTGYDGHFPVSKVDVWRLGLDTRRVRASMGMYSISEYTGVL
jgi:hypothetical protein